MSKEERIKNLPPAIPVGVFLKTAKLCSQVMDDNDLAPGTRERRICEGVFWEGVHWGINSSDEEEQKQ